MDLSIQPLAAMATLTEIRSVSLLPLNIDNLPKNYAYFFISESSNRQTFRIAEVRDADSAQVWLSAFSESTKTTWRVMKTFPRSSKFNIYKKIHRCQHKTDSRRRNIQSSKNTGCPALLTTTIKKYIDKPKKRNYPKDPLDASHPAIIELRHQHNHSLSSASFLSHRSMSEQTRLCLQDLFCKGHCPPSALYCMKIDLMLAKPDDFHQLCADTSIIPKLRTIWHCFEQEFKKKYGEASGHQLVQDFLQYIDRYNTTTQDGSCRFGQVDQDYFISVCTPLMQRVLTKVPQAAELMLVDTSSGGRGKNRHRLYFFAIPTAAGALPVGAILTNSEKKEVFSAACKVLLEIMPADKFYKSSGPAVIITDDLTDREALVERFPSSKILMCQFHVLKSVWSWLCEPKHSVNPEKRQEIYYSFRNCLLSDYIDLLEDNYIRLLSFVSNIKNQKLDSYIETLWQKRVEWAQCFRQGLHGTNTTHYMMLVFRIIKDRILDKAMTFNVRQLLDFLVVRFEKYWTKKLTDFSDGKGQHLTIRKWIFPLLEENTLAVHEQGDGNFSAHEAQNEGNVYIVDLMKWVCACRSGVPGTLCQHMAAVIKHLDDESASDDKLNCIASQLKRLMHEVATGTAPASGLLICRQKNVSVQSSISSNEDHEVVSPEGTISPEAHMSPIPGRSKEKVENGFPPNYSTFNDDSHDLEENDEASYESDFNRCSQMLRFFTDRVEKCMRENPSTFIPAIEKMHIAVSKFKTDTDLLSILTTMANYKSSAVPRISSKKELSILSRLPRISPKKDLKNLPNKRSVRVLINVQPTPIRSMPALTCPPQQSEHVSNVSAEHGAAPPSKKIKCENNF